MWVITLSARIINRELSDSEREHLLRMLTAIARLPPDTPVGAMYSRRGVIEKQTVFVVHKVFFYRPKE
jgi:hypothetical protein